MSNLNNKNKEKNSFSNRKVSKFSINIKEKRFQSQKVKRDFPIKKDQLNILKKQYHFLSVTETIFELYNRCKR